MAIQPAKLAGKILFVIGSALGHIARSFVIARQLQRGGYDVHFAGKDASNLAREVVAPRFPLHILAFKDKIEFATALANCIEVLSPRAVCYDLSSLWLFQLPPLSVPEIYITNAFLTRLGKHKTPQDIRFTQNGTHWNAQREKRGLSPLSDNRELYEKDLVLLADPPELLADRVLPDHYRVIGPCSWNPPIPLPDEVRPLRNILYVSTGSSGDREIPEAFVRSLADELDCTHIVSLKGKGNPTNLTAYSYARLPSDAVLNRARFVLTHGGTGSTYQALERGVPVGCWPRLPNHQVFSQWIEQLGIAIIFQPDSWKAKLSGMGNTLPKLTARARKLAQSLADLDSGIEASKHIEALLIHSADS